MSQETTDSQVKAKEIKDSYEEQSLSNGSGRVRVEIPVDKAFDRDAYSKVSAVSSQPSQITQHSQLSQLSQPSEIRSWSQLASSRARLFIWDEEVKEGVADHEGEPGHSVPIIQGTQSIHASSSYQPSQTQASIAAATADSDLATASSLAQSSAAAVHPTSSSGSSHHPSSSCNLEYSELPSGRVDGSRRTQSQHLTFPDRSQDSYILQASGALGLLGDSLSRDTSHAQPEILRSVCVASPPTSSENPLTVAHQDFSPDTSQTFSQVHPHQPSYSASDKSSLRFQTQVPLSSQDEVSSPNISHHVGEG